MGLFYNGNNPLDIRNGYGPSDFDRTHVFNVDYHYELPKFFATSTWEGKVADGWAVQGLVIIQSGQPYSVIDYSGAVGSIFYSIYDGITNPIVPLNFAPGCTPQNAVTGATGDTPGPPALKASCFTVPLLTPGDLNGGFRPAIRSKPISPRASATSSGSPGRRRADISIVKMTQLTERFALKYTFDVFNLTNTPSFDIPIDNVTQNLTFSQAPVQGTAPLPTGCGTSSATTGFYFCPTGLGQVTKTIGSSRQIQMSLSFSF